MRVWISLLVMLAATAPGTAQVGTDEATAKTPKIETSYNVGQDKTTVRMNRMQISGARGRYYSLHLAPAYSITGQVPRPPEIIDFELQTVVKARKLQVDLYVIFVIDGEKIFLSSNRWGVKRPVPGRPWVGERLVFRMPNETLLKLSHAKQALIRMDGIDFELNEDHLRALRAFAATMPNQREKGEEDKQEKANGANEPQFTLFSL
jgi:hypothetical protein